MHIEILLGNEFMNYKHLQTREEEVFAQKLRELNEEDEIPQILNVE